MTKLLNIVLSVTTILFAALYFGSKEQPELPNVKLASLSEPTDLKKENILLRQELSKLKKELDLLKNMPERVVKVKETGQGLTTQPTVETSDGVASFKKMMEDPSVQAMMQKRRNDMVNDRYGSILERLDLPEAEKEKLVTLLGDKFLYRMQTAMRMRAAETDEEKENIKASQEELSIENDNKIADLLGPKHDTYLSYEEKRQEYQMLESINEKDESSPLSQQQTDDLAAVIKETSDSFEFSNAEIQDNPRAYRELSDEDKKQYKIELQERDAQVLEEVSDSLTDAQLEQFKKEQKRNRERLTSSRGGSPFGRRGGRR